MAMNQRSANNLVLQARKDPDAFGELVEANHKLILWKCYRRVKDWYHAEDLAQEAFIRAYTKLGKLHEPANFSNWLQRIASNLCSEFMRRQARYRGLIEGMSERTDRNGLSQDMDLDLDSLPEDTRRCVRMFYLSGLSYAEIAERLETSAAAVKGRLARAKRILRKEMAAMAPAKGSPFTERVLETLRQLESEASDQRARAAGKLGRALGEDPVERHLALLRDPDPTKRGNAVRSSRRLHSPRIRSALVDILLSDTWEENRMRAANALVAQGDPSVIPDLETARQSKHNPQEVTAAAKSAIRQLERLEPPASREAEDLQFRKDVEAVAQDKQARVELLRRIRASLADPDPDVRAKAVRACLELGDKRAVPALAKLLHDPLAGIQNAAARALGSLGGKQAVRFLIKVVQTTRDLRSLQNVIFALSEIGDPIALPHVINAMDKGLNRNLNIAWACSVYFTMAASAADLPVLRPALEQLTAKAEGLFWFWWSRLLSKLGEERHLPELIEAFQHAPDHAVAGLVRIGGPKAVSVLRDRLWSQPSHTIAKALCQSGELGLEALRAGLKGDSVKVRRAAAHGMRLAKTSGQGNQG